MTQTTLQPKKDNAHSVLRCEAAVAFKPSIKLELDTFMPAPNLAPQCVYTSLSRTKNILFLCPYYKCATLEGVLQDSCRTACSKLNLLTFTGADRIYIGGTGAFYSGNISAEDVKLFLLKQTYKSLHFLLRQCIFLPKVVWLAVPSKASSQPIWLKVLTHHGYNDCNLTMCVHQIVDQSNYLAEGQT